MPHAKVHKSRVYAVEWRRGWIDTRDMRRREFATFYDLTSLKSYRVIIPCDVNIRFKIVSHKKEE